MLYIQKKNTLSPIPQDYSRDIFTFTPLSLAPMIQRLNTGNAATPKEPNALATVLAGVTFPYVASIFVAYFYLHTPGEQSQLMGPWLHT